MAIITPQIISWPEIRERLRSVDLITAMASAFSAYSQGHAVIPPVGELQFTDPPGDVHIKYGYINEGSHYVVKIASGFYENPQLGIPSSQGLMLLFDQKTGQLASVLLDEGRLTDERTGAAGAVAAKYLGPSNIHCIGIVGTGIQARCQLRHLSAVTPCREGVVWGRNADRAEQFCRDAAKFQMTVQVVKTLAELGHRANLIVTTTPAEKPLLKAEWITAGTHITAIGADGPNKQELDSGILSKADLVVVDSIEQSKNRGEVFRAVDAGAISPDSAIELGQIITGIKQGRTHQSQITVADLTGVAVQDLVIAQAVINGAP
jgi:ornithine cyclodeaminase